MTNASESVAVLAITQSRDEIRRQLDAVNENVRELTRRATTSSGEVIAKEAELKNLSESYRVLEKHKDRVSVDVTYQAGACPH